MRIGWIVDVQNDFMNPEGRLYVKNLKDPEDEGAQKIYGALNTSVQWMQENCDALVFTGDWHGPEDEEISNTPDFLNTYPPHCMGRSEDFGEALGAGLHPCVGPEFVMRSPILWRLPLDGNHLDGTGFGILFREYIKREETSLPAIFIEKTKFDVFEGNQSTSDFLASLTEGESAEIFVCGVATDVCVKFAVDGLIARKHDVKIIMDAVYGLGITPPEELFGEWLDKGVGGVLTKDLNLYSND